MADKTWVSTNGDVADPASWSPTGQPQPGDNLFIGPGTQTGLTVNANAFATVVFGIIRFTKQFTGAIGGPGAPFVVNGDSIAKFVFQGTGDAYFHIDPSGGAGTVIWDSDATLWSTNRLGSTFIARRGIVNMSNSSDANTIIATTHPTGATPTINIFGDTGTTISTLFCGAGTVNAERSITSVRLSGGRINKTQKKSSTIQMFGGVYQDDADDAGGNTFTIIGGVADFSQTPHAKTATLIEVFTGGDYVSNGSLTITSLIDARGETPLFA